MFVSSYNNLLNFFCPVHSSVRKVLSALLDLQSSLTNDGSGKESRFVGCYRPILHLMDVFSAYLLTFFGLIIWP